MSATPVGRGGRIARTCAAIAVTAISVFGVQLLAQIVFIATGWAPLLAATAGGAISVFLAAALSERFFEPFSGRVVFGALVVLMLPVAIGITLEFVQDGYRFEQLVGVGSILGTLFAGLSAYLGGRK